jgi:hypothetical protein
MSVLIEIWVKNPFKEQLPHCALKSKKRLGFLPYPRVFNPVLTKLIHGLSENRIAETVKIKIKLRIE